MLPSELITGPLAVAVGFLCLTLTLLGIVARLQSKAKPNATVSRGSVFNDREKSRAILFAQAFVFGMACALFGVILLVNHERSAFRKAGLRHSQVTAVNTSIPAPSSQKVR